MCNLYSVTKGQEAIRRLFEVQRDLTGNMPLFPGVYPDSMAPVVRLSPHGGRELGHELRVGARDLLLPALAEDRLVRRQPHARARLRAPLLRDQGLDGVVDGRRAACAEAAKTRRERRAATVPASRIMAGTLSIRAPRPHREIP